MLGGQGISGKVAFKFSLHIWLPVEQKWREKPPSEGCSTCERWSQEGRTDLWGQSEGPNLAPGKRQG